MIGVGKVGKASLSVGDTCEFLDTCLFGDTGERLTVKEVNSTTVKLAFTTGLKIVDTDKNNVSIWLPRIKVCCIKLSDFHKRFKVVTRG